MSKSPFPTTFGRDAAIVEAARKIQPHRADRHAVAAPAAASRKASTGCAPATSARSSAPAGFATNAAPASARWMARSRFRRALTMTCGAARRPKEPLMRKKLHYDWHWVWPTGNGDLGNQGIHQMDIARWVLGENELSPRVLSIGGRLGYDDDGTTPNTRSSSTTTQQPRSSSKCAVCPPAARFREHGQLPRRQHRRGGGLRRRLDGHSELRQCQGRGQAGQARSRNSAKAAPAISPTSSRPCAAASRATSTPTSWKATFPARCATPATSPIAWARPIRPTKIREAVNGNKDLAETLGRMEEHLAANKVDLKKTPATLGAVLKMDLKTERFIGNCESQ